MTKNTFPPGWDEERVHRVLSYYESQTENEAVAEDESAYERVGYSMVEIPTKLLPTVRNILAQHHAQK